jgi:flavin-dependent dehydrogenase
MELVRAGLAVAVLERSRYAEDRVGDTLPPEAAPWLTGLEVAEAIRAVPSVESPGVLSLWGGAEPGETDFLFNLYGSGRHLDRARFDASLAVAAEQAGAAVVRGAALRASRQAGGGWVVTAAVDGRSVEFAGRWVIDATGRSAWFVRRQGVKTAAADRLVAVVARIERGLDPDDRLLLEAVPDGWWYQAPLPGGRAVVAFLTDSDLLPKGDRLRPFWDRQRATSRLIGNRIRTADGHPRLQVLSAATRWAGTVAGTGWFAAGDAAVAHDPLSGSGVWRALASGWEAARAALSADSGDTDAVARYQRSAEARYRAYRVEQARAYGQVTDWPDRPFWRRRSPMSV